MKTAINTSTQEEYDALMKWRKENGCEYPHVSYFHHNGYSTCVLVGIPFLFASVAFYKSQGYSIIPYTEFAKANIVEEVDYRALYLEGRELLKGIVIFSEENGEPVDGFKFRENVLAAKAYITKHKDLT